MRVLRKILGPKGRKLANKELLYQILLASDGRDSQHARNDERCL
jgi:hypothetical protein